MPVFLKYLIRGAVLIIIALPISLAYNATRSSSLPLIPKVAPTKTSQSEGTAVTEAEGSTETALYPDGLASLEQTKSLYESKEAIFVDARPEQDYEAGHIPGSINIPYDKIIELYDTIQETLPMSELILCYCWSPTCDFSDILAKELRMMGYERVIVFQDGWDAWEGASYPGETGKPTGD